MIAQCAATGDPGDHGTDAALAEAVNRDADGVDFTEAEAVRLSLINMVHILNAV